MKSVRRCTLLLALLASLSVTPLLAQSPAPPRASQTPAPSAPVRAAPAPAASAGEVPLEEIRRYVSVYRAIRQAYVEPLTDEQIMKAALRGLLSDLDPHSSYLDRSASQSLSERARGAYDGIGIELEQSPARGLIVIAPIDDTPAARAGLRAGDHILAIDGQAVMADSVDEASEQLRGAPGSAVVLTIQRSGETTPRDVRIVRETIRITSVSARLLEPGYGYLRVSMFQNDTGAQLRRHLASLAQKSGGRLQGVVLDLRSNPGGLLNAAVEAADLFLESGIIVSTRGRLSQSNTVYRATPGDALAGAPLVVLVDAGSASAAEVLAGALRDSRRALIMGSRTYGKGSVQTVVPLDNGDSIKLTTSRYYTPSGRSIQANGIRPDVVLNGDAVRGLREADLPGHLRGDEEETGRYATGVVISGEAAIGEALARLKLSAGRTAAAPAAAAAR